MNYLTTQRRVSLAALAALMVFVPLTSGGAGAAGEAAAKPPAIYEARAEAAAFADSFVVPAQIDTFTPYSLSETASGSSHGLQAVFYPGFLLSAAAFQQGFPPPPGTTETLYPQGPTDGKSQVLPIPGFAGSSGKSGPASSSGEAHYGVGGSGDSGGTFGLAKTSVSAESATVRSVADVVLNQVRLGGGLIIGSVVAKAEATADGTPGGAANSGSVTLNGLTLSGMPLTISPDSFQAGEQKNDVPNPEGVNPALAAAGISIRRLPDTRVTSDDGTESHLDLGGYEIRIDQPDREFHARFVLGRVSVMARAVRSGS